MTETKLLLIGLDGATFDFLSPLIEDQKLPFIKKMIDNGISAKLLSTIPCISPTAWASFITGKNPGKHGVYDFVTKTHGRYDWQPVITNIQREGSLWKFLSDMGKKVAVVNMPMTYPPENLNGIMVSGFGTPNMECSFTFPKEFKNELLEKGYIQDVMWSRYGTDETEKLLGDLDELADNNFSVAKRILSKEQWDFFALGIVTTDRMQHALWNHIQEYIENKKGPIIDRIIQHYNKLDRYIEKLFKLGGFTDIIIMSDHGFGSCTRRININLILENNNLFQFDRKHRTLKSLKKGLKKIGIVQAVKKLRSTKTVQRDTNGKTDGYSKSIFSFCDWEKTKAFAHSTDGIYINKKNREKSGIVEEGQDFESICEKVKNTLLAFRIDNKPVFYEIKTRDEIYAGSELNLAPDLIITDYDRSCVVDVVAKADDPIVNTNMGRMTGTHRPDGIFIAIGENISSNIKIKKINLCDLFPNILSLYRLPIPNDIDGNIINEMHAIEPEIKIIDKKRIESEKDQELTAKEKDDIVESLKGLGYL